MEEPERVARDHFAAVFAALADWHNGPERSAAG
jgi:hypothetical protein